MMIGMSCKDTKRESLCGLLVPETRTHGSITLLSEKVLFHILSDVFGFWQELSYLRMIIQNDGITWITAVGIAIQGKGTVVNLNFQTQLIPCTSLVDDHASNRAAETVLAREPSAQEGKQSYLVMNLTNQLLIVELLCFLRCTLILGSTDRSHRSSLTNSSFKQRFW